MSAVVLCATGMQRAIRLIAFNRVLASDWHNMSIHIYVQKGPDALILRPRVDAFGEQENVAS